MIYFRISGGLGNQMFQMAAAYSLALEKNTNVGVCLDRIEANVHDSAFTQRSYEVAEVFRLDVVKQIDAKRLEFYLKSDVSLIHKVKRKLKTYGLFLEKSLQFDSTFFKLPNEAVIDGYFQSEKYFINKKQEIIELFQFSEPRLSDQTITTSKNISENSVAVHVRRGDYVNNPEINQVHGSCNIDYYQNSINYLEKHYELGLIYIFSDDPEWVKENLKFKSESIVIDWNQGSDSWQDMYLMSKCKYFVIANSSFSWWGAYLSQVEGKQVIAPSRWFADENKNKQTNDLIPASWIKI